MIIQTTLMMAIQIKKLVTFLHDFCISDKCDTVKSQIINIPKNKGLSLATLPREY